MKKSLRTIIMALFSLPLLITSGCFVWHGTSSEWCEDDVTIHETGPGSGWAEFVKRTENKYHRDDGSRVAIGFCPGMAHQSSAAERITWPFASILLHCFICGPTIASLFAAPFSGPGGERTTWSEMGLLGCYKWIDKGTIGRRLEKTGDSEMLVKFPSNFHPSFLKRDLAPLHLTMTEYDGMKLYFEYPGGYAIESGLNERGKVAVLFQSSDRYRIFLPARHFKGHYTYKDVNIDSNFRYVPQIQYIRRSQAIKSNASHWFSHKRFGSKAKALANSVDRLIAILPGMDDVALTRLEKEIETMSHNVDFCEQADKLLDAGEWEKVVKLCDGEKNAAFVEEYRNKAVNVRTKVHRKAVDKGWPNEGALRDFALRESPVIWQTIEQIRLELSERRKVIVQLRSERQELGSNPDSDPDFRKLGKEVDAMLDSLVSIFENLEKAYIAAKRYEATSGRKDYETIMRTALESGIKETEGTATRYVEMRDKK